MAIFGCNHEFSPAVAVRSTKNVHCAKTPFLKQRLPNAEKYDSIIIGLCQLSKPTHVFLCLPATDLQICLGKRRQTLLPFGGNFLFLSILAEIVFQRLRAKSISSINKYLRPRLLSSPKRICFSSNLLMYRLACPVVTES